MKNPLIIGLMSGTSLDGIDLAACRFYFNGVHWSYSVEKAQTIPYTAAWITKLKDANQLSGAEIIKLHHDYGNYLGKVLNEFLGSCSLNPDYISSHGHTIFHQPEKGFTFQLGHGANIAAITGITTICDFRTIDVALGGQGAPLVPVGDELLYSQYDACLNLGGISNISFKINCERTAYDIGICNMGLNFMAGLMGMSYDKDGAVAASGNINGELFKIIHTVYQQHHAQKQSLGVEWFESYIKPILLQHNCTVEDKLRTLTECIVHQIGKEIEGKQNVLVTGGGTHNKLLINLLQKYSKANIIIPNEQTINFKEAIIFAFLGRLRLLQQTNTLKQVTGANSNSCGGAVYLATK